jgi:class 3 adenylate cyclase
MGAAGGLPEGTPTFLFTDLEGSTRMFQAQPAAYRDAVRHHHDLLRVAVEAHGGGVRGNGEHRVRRLRLAD